METYTKQHSSFDGISILECNIGSAGAFINRPVFPNKHHGTHDNNTIRTLHKTVQNADAARVENWVNDTEVQN